jgi:hypothetical protein
MRGWGALPYGRADAPSLRWRYVCGINPLIEIAWRGYGKPDRK